MTKRILLRMLSAVILTSGIGIYAQTTPSGAKPDNTKVNKQDRSAGAPTADQGKNNKSDVKLAAEVRKAIRNDKSLSTYAKNVKVIAQGGQITLKGPVRTEEEKQAVVSAAKSAAGGANVTDDITIAPKKTK